MRNRASHYSEIEIGSKRRRPRRAAVDGDVVLWTLARVSNKGVCRSRRIRLIAMRPWYVWRSCEAAATPRSELGSYG